MKTLFLAEKPATIEAVAALFPGERVKKGAGFSLGDKLFAPLAGHVFTQAMPDEYLPDDVPLGKTGNKKWRLVDLPVIPTRWKLIPDQGKQRYWSTAKDMLSLCDEIVHLGDADEEGQLLVDEVLEYYGNRKPVKRVLITDYNEKKVREALNAIKDNNDPVFRGWHNWALARTRYDWLFGLNLTRAYTIKWQESGGKGVLNVGSVQSPLLKVIVDRDRAIESFVAMPYQTIQACLEHKNGAFTARWKPSENQLGLDSEGRLIDQHQAQLLADKVRGKTGAISRYEVSRKRTAPPLLFSQSSIQMAANDKYGYSAKEALDACQSLYDIHKLLTYPRVDVEYIFEVRHGEAAQVMAAICSNYPDMQLLCDKAELSRKSAAFNDSKVKVHHAIIPTEGRVDIRKLTVIERNIYDMVVRSYIAQFYPDYEFNKTDIEAMITNERFITTGSTPLIEGWHEVLKPAQPIEKEDEEAQTLPIMNVNDEAICADIKINAKKTTPPPRFTEKLLVQAMLNIHEYVEDQNSKKRLKEGDGIGTDATRAEHIEGLKQSGFITPIKSGSKQLLSTEPARALMDALAAEVKEPGTAGIFKLDLDRVASGDLSFESFMRQTEAFVSRLVEAARNSSIENQTESVPCPKCGSGHLRRIKGSKGFFWSCSNWYSENKCDATFDDEKGKPALEKKTYTCPACKKGELRKIKRPKEYFWGCNRYSEGCKYTAPDNKGKPGERTQKAPEPSNHSCPDCGKALVHRQKPGKDGYDFWGCTGYPACKSSFKNDAGKPAFKAVSTT